MAKKKEMKPEKLKTLTTNEGVPKPKVKPKKLDVITTTDLPRPRKIKVAKSYKPSENTVITTGNFKPRKFKDMAKL